MTKYWEEQMAHGPTEHYYKAMLLMLSSMGLDLPLDFTVLEIGTGWGISGRAFLVTGCTELVTIDPNMNARYVRSAIAELEATKGKGQKITYIQASSEDLDELRELKGKRFDVIFIDGRHDYASVKRDMARSEHFLKPKGVMILDDYTHPKNGGEYGVAQAVTEFMEDADDVTLVEDLTGNGLAAIIHT